MAGAKSNPPLIPARGKEGKGRFFGRKRKINLAFIQASVYTAKVY
jgi:hypothetical protein